MKLLSKIKPLQLNVTQYSLHLIRVLLCLLCYYSSIESYQTIVVIIHRRQILNVAPKQRQIIRYESSLYTKRTSYSRQRLLVSNIMMMSDMVGVNENGDDTTIMMNGEIDQDNNDDHDNSNSSNIDIQNAIQFARYVNQLKRTPRTGWVRRGIPNYESVADHSYSVATLCLLLFNNNNNNTLPSIDVNKCIQLAMIHDLAECIVGDITPDDNISKDDKHQMEYNAIQKIASYLKKKTTSMTTPATEQNQQTTTTNTNNDSSIILLNLFHEYEERITYESKIVKDLDLFDMLLQADEYEKLYPTIDLNDFFISTLPNRFIHPMIRHMANSIHIERNNNINMIKKQQQEQEVQQQQEQEVQQKQQIIKTMMESEEQQEQVQVKSQHDNDEAENTNRILLVPRAATINDDDNVATKTTTELTTTATTTSSSVVVVSNNNDTQLTLSDQDFIQSFLKRKQQKQNQVLLDIESIQEIIGAYRQWIT